MGSELDDDMGDFDPNSSANSGDDKVDSVLIKKILYEMKSEFNRGMCSVPNDSNEVTSNALIDNGDVKENGHSDSLENMDISLETQKDLFSNTTKVEPSLPEDVHQSPSVRHTEQVEDNKDILCKDEESDSVSNYDSISSDRNNDDSETSKRTFKVSKSFQKTKSAPESSVQDENVPLVEKKGRRSVRNAEIAVKRSSRRMSKEFSRESVLQNAIARKEKSMSSLSSSEKQRKSNRISEEKVTKKKAKVDEQPFKGFTDSGKSTPSKGKSPTLTPNYINENDHDEALSQISTPKKTTKISLPHVENGFDEELSNQQSSQHSENDWDKGNDSSSNFSTSSIKAKKKTFSFSSESYQTIVKRPRPDNSPVIPEASDVPPCEASLPPIAWSRGVCECQRNDSFYPSKSSYRGRGTCKALDSFEERVVGCINRVGEDSPLLRPSPTVPYVLMCDVHIARLIRHNCCPSCGLFCIQGYFLQCKDQHFFHKDCALMKDDASLCPHCSSNELVEVKLSIGTLQYPIFHSTQTPNRKHPAKMSINRGSYPEVDLKDDEELKTLIPLRDLTINKSKSSSDGIPTPEKERFSGRGFYQACRHGDTEKVLSMLEGGNCHNKDGGTLVAFHAAASNGHLGVVHLLAQFGIPLETLDKSQYTPLMLAVLNSHNSVVKYLVKAGANVAFKGSDGMTALHLAAKTGNLVACRHLLSATHKSFSFVDITDDGHWTPLVWAAENNHAQVVKFLLENKADPQIRDSEMNIALHWSAFAGSMEITEDLLNYGTDINAANAHGDTPLHIAARQGAENCVMFLLARGARTDMKNTTGQLPRDCVLPEFSYCKTAIEFNMKINRSLTKHFFYPKIVSNDVSRGHELNPIQCINNVDKDPAPRDFTYIIENCVTSQLPIDRRITSLSGCKCDDGCTTGHCMCSKTSLRCWYDNLGRLLPGFNFEDPPMIFECNQTCECNAGLCRNRVVQKGLRVRLQVCKTKRKNWGVITLREIPKGSYVCEYIGEIISDCEADTREDDSYLFDLDNRDGESYCIDACKYGNVTRFINHSCKPNLVPVRIFVGHQDLHFPRIAFFAARDIPSNEELGFDYGEKFWVIKYKNFTCSCEELNCRYSSETIHDTLEKYKERLKHEDSL